MAKPYSRGGAKLNQKFSELRTALEDYYGALAQILNNIQVEVPDKPIICVYVDQFMVTNKLYNDGGLGDQPYIFMQEFKIAYDRMKLHERLSNRNKQERNNAKPIQ